MFERFTERARQVIVLAQDEARTLEHDYIGTEHLLLGLLREQDGVAGRLLSSLGITIDDVRSQVLRIVGTGDEVASGQMPFTPRAKRVLELALREALSLGHDYIGTEHLLLGLVREHDGVAARILLGFDADLRARVLHALGWGPEVATPPRAAGATGPGDAPTATRFPFAARAEVVLELAQEEARLLKHNYIGTEHILLGLLREGDGLAARALASLGIRPAAVRTQVARFVGEGDEVTLGRLPVTPRVRRCLELALREARSHGHLHVGTEHLLLGLALEDEGVASLILRESGVDAGTIRTTVARMLSAPGRDNG
jgi:ATP-dependent Clp protease ATP-binding subunit ClpA